MAKKLLEDIHVKKYYKKTILFAHGKFHLKYYKILKYIMHKN